MQLLQEVRPGLPCFEPLVEDGATRGYRIAGSDGCERRFAVPDRVQMKQSEGDERMATLGKRFFAPAIAIAVLGSGLPALGEDKARPAKAEVKDAPKENVAVPAIGEDADRLLKDMSNYLNEARELSFHAEIMYDDLLPSGQKILLAAAHDVAVHRPDRLYSSYQGEVGRKRLWYDGKTVTLLDDASNTYATEKVPSTIDGTLDHLITQLGFTPPLSDLLYDDPHAVLRRNAIFGFRVGFSDVQGARCHHLAFVEDHVDWQIWIDDGKLRVPRKLAITYKTLPGAPQFIAVLSDWDFTTRLPNSLFTPELPGGAAKIDFLKAAAPLKAGKQAAPKKP